MPVRTDFELALPAAASDAALRDADVVHRLRRGERQQAFEQLLQRYETKVFHLCVAMLGNEAIAEEAAQDALLRIWRALEHYDADRAALSTWIYAITRNRCLSVMQRRPDGEHSLELDDIRQEAEQIAAPNAMHDAASLARLRRMVESLPASQAMAMKLYYFEDHSISEVAAMLELPEGTVKTHLHRARKSLHAALQAAGLADPALWR